MATNPKNSNSTGVEKVEISEVSTPPDTSDKLDEFKRSLDSQKSTTDEREKLLLESLSKIFNQNDISILDNIENVDAFDEKMKETLSSATEICLALLLVKGLKADSIMDITDGFTFEKNGFSRSFIKALVFIQKNKENEVSKWYLKEGFNAAKKSSKKLASAGAVIKDTIQGKDSSKDKDSSEKGFIDDVKDFAGKNKTAIGLFAFAGAAVGGIWAYKKLFGEEKDVKSESSGIAGTATKVALYAAGGAFVAGQGLGLEEVRRYLSKDKDSWVI